MSLGAHRTTCLRYLVVLLMAVAGGCSKKPAAQEAAKGAPESAAGSSACRTCHPAFYKKWATSHHGRAMQPFTGAFAKSALTPQASPMKIGASTYQAILGENSGDVEERGPNGTRNFPIAHVMGGKNTYYFLTPMERGRLQVLPLAYDVHTEKWYDMAASGVRMHGEGPAGDPLPWTDPAFTFNTSCFSCHVSQLRTNYNLEADTYRTTWSEPGINCETCHGDGSAHVALYKKDLSAKHADMRILRTTKFTVQQRNEMCAPCHAKMSPISPGYQVTQKFFDHYDLVTLEDADYFPDGRDLGENYTYTSWLMSPCVRGGKFDCIHCHTSSGRYRFATENPNGACQPCHEDKVTNPQVHSQHKPGPPGGNCVDCHMPKTRFANMNRSDHSMLPPTPAATLKFKSPNACNLCHKDRTPAWADAQVRKWRSRDYQKPVLERAALVDAARRGDWAKLPAMLAYLGNAAGDPVTQASLIRLLGACDDQRKLPAVLSALRHPSPLIRAAAVSSLGRVVTLETRDALAQATADEYRLVRIRAAASLAGVPVNALPAQQQQSVEKATAELIASYQARPDDFANHTNLGNFYMDRGQLEQSIRSFETAIRLRPDSVGTLVNASIAYSRAGRVVDAERVLDQALRHAPDNAAANFNQGLLLAEIGKKPEAEIALRRALSSDPKLAAAAYNLCVLQLERRDSGGLDYCKQAVKADPDNEKYTLSLAYYLDQARRPAEAIRLLEAFHQRRGDAIESRMLLADIYLKTGRNRDALAIYQTAASNRGLSEGQRRLIESRLRVLQPR